MAPTDLDPDRDPVAPTDQPSLQILLSMTFPKAIRSGFGALVLLTKKQLKPLSTDANRSTTGKHESGKQAVSRLLVR
jgi:hypothetical protein